MHVGQPAAAKARNTLMIKALSCHSHGLRTRPRPIWFPASAEMTGQVGQRLGGRNSKWLQIPTSASGKDVFGPSDASAATHVSTGQHCGSYTKFLDFVLGPGGLPVFTYQPLPDSSVHRELPNGHLKEGNCPFLPSPP